MKEGNKSWAESNFRTMICRVCKNVLLCAHVCVCERARMFAICSGARAFAHVVFSKWFCCLRKCWECENVYHVYNMRLLHRIFLIVTNIILFDVLGALVFDLLQNFIVILVCWCPFSTSAMWNIIGLVLMRWILRLVYMAGYNVVLFSFPFAMNRNWSVYAHLYGLRWIPPFFLIDCRSRWVECCRSQSFRQNV